LRKWYLFFNDNGLFNLLSCVIKLSSYSIGDGFIEIWDYERGECLSKSNPHSKHIWQLGLTPTGELISASGDMTIKTWLIEGNKLKCVRNLGEHYYEPCSFIIKEDGILVSGSCDGFKKFDLYEDTLLEIMNFKYISDHPQIQFVSI
jgi:WD40 repeat protein